MIRGQVIQAGEILIFIVAAHLAIRGLRGAWRDGVFAALNVGAFYLFFFSGKGNLHTAVFAAYLGLAGIQYTMLRLFVSRTGKWPWVAFATPLLALILIRYVPESWYMRNGERLGFAPLFIGISYLAFRCSHLVLEVRNGVAPAPGFFRYVGFCFFVPTMPVGPINPYGNYNRAFDAEPPVIPAERAWMRILVGLVKYKFLGSVFFQLSYVRLLFDDHYHPWIDLPVAMVFYYLYLYCNFSGFCDVAIGGAGLIGVPVAENFNNPFAARNVKEFWNRWHITLSQYMRDVVFTPLSKYLARVMGPKFVNHAVAISIVVVFLLVGVWHGVGWNYVAFGAVHAAGVAANHYYTIALKKRLGRDGLRAYNANQWIQAVAVAITFCYCAAALFLFANTFGDMKQIFSVLR
jgi:D-alanyl-lipoteichoic acid acyltransferase DltB (MBOAT superfamily)